MLLSFAFCYIGCVAQVNTSKVSSHLVAMETRFSEKGQSESGVEKTPTVNALVTLARSCDAAAFFVAHDCRLIDNVGRIFIVDIPLEPEEVSEYTIVKIHDIIRAEKPAHTMYYLRFKGKKVALSEFQLLVGDEEIGYVIGSGDEIVELGEAEVERLPGEE